MGMSKLNDWESRSIAEVIAKKAMEHLTAPVDKEIDYFVRTCHENLLVDLGIAGREKEFLDAGVLHEVGSITVQFIIDEDKTYAETIRSGDKKLLLGVPCGGWKIDSPALIEAYLELHGKRLPFRLRRSAFASELKQQMLGKSAKYIMKTWPEAAEFVAQYFNIDIATGKDVSMTAPLSELLAKYMPMLSAPQPEMEGA